MSNVVIFDSGVGGLSIYQAVDKAQAANQGQAQFDYVFVSDNHAFPYGTKAEPELIERVISVVTAIVERYDPQILVVACNTASTVVLPKLRQLFDFPIVGVVPAIKPAAMLSKTRHIAVLATPATIERPYTDKLIADYASDCEVTKLGSSDLVELAEKKLYGETIEISQLESILKPVLDLPSIDVLVLACTHFPLLREELEQVFDHRKHAINLVDSTQGIANRVSVLSKELINDPTQDRIKNRMNKNEIGTTYEQKIAAFTDNISQQGEYLIKLKNIGFTDIQTLLI